MLQVKAVLAVVRSLRIKSCGTAYSNAINGINSDTTNERKEESLLTAPPLTNEIL